jgi:hypothetical protein
MCDPQFQIMPPSGVAAISASRLLCRGATQLRPRPARPGSQNGAKRFRVRRLTRASTSFPLRGRQLTVGRLLAISAKTGCFRVVLLRALLLLPFQSEISNFTFSFRRLFDSDSKSNPFHPSRRRRGEEWSTRPSMKAKRWEARRETRSCPGRTDRSPENRSTPRCDRAIAITHH